MRNIFDQYSQPENKLTHALISSLSQDKKLLHKFVSWAIPFKIKIPNRAQLKVVEQSLPGEEELGELESIKRGLPDACIYTDDGWILIIESKVKSSISRDQLVRHINTIKRRGFENPILLVLSPDEFIKNLPRRTVLRLWKDIYEWGFNNMNKSSWAKIFKEYFEILEAKMVQDEYLTEGALTKFSGVPFNSKYPYTYLEAKRILKLIIKELKQDKIFLSRIGLDAALQSRGKITKGRGVWDFIRVKEARSVGSFTKYPHLTLYINNDVVGITITLPDKSDKQISQRIFNKGINHLQNMTAETLSLMKKAMAMDPSLKPVIKLLQRHYPYQSHPGIADATLTFDLRTLITKKTVIKYQPQWLKTVYEVMNNKKSNIQFQIGAEIPLNDSKVLNTEKSLELIKLTALAFASFLEVALERKK